MSIPIISGFRSLKLFQLVFAEVCLFEGSEYCDYFVDTFSGQDIFYEQMSMGMMMMCEVG